MPGRTFATLAALVLATPAAAQGAWEVLPNSPVASETPGIGRFDDLEAVGPDTLYIASGTKRVYRSTDAGASWALTYEAPGTPYFRSLGFVSGTHGFLGTLGGSAAGALYETTDGGHTFAPIADRITGPLPTAVCGIFALDREAVFAVGGISDGSHFLRTLDAGQTWTSTDMSAQAAFLIDVHFHDRQRGIAVGGSPGTPGYPVVLGTVDGGATWTERFRGTGTAFGWAWKISFATPEVGYVSVENQGQVLRTTDGGVTWVALAVPGVSSMQGIGFVTPDTGWLSGRGQPRTTTDGGLTWSPTPEVRLTTNRFVFFGDTLGYAVADRVLRYRPGATPAEPPPAPAAFHTEAAYPNPTPARVLIPYVLPQPAEVTLEVFDALGRRVSVTAYGLRPAGPDEALWPGLDDAGRPAAPGTYVYRLRAGTDVASGTFVVAPL